MKPNLSFYLIMLVSALVLLGYLACLNDWVDDYQTGYYQTHLLEAYLESGLIVIYTYLGVRFGLRNVNMRL